MAFSSQKAKLLTFFQDDPELEVLWLYGSHAKNTAHKNSDIDLAITFKNWIDDPIERRLRPELLAVEWQRALGLNEGMLSILDMSIAPIPMAMSFLTTGNYFRVKISNFKSNRELCRAGKLIIFTTTKIRSGFMDNTYMKRKIKR